LSRYSPYFKEPEHFYCNHRTCHCLHPGLHESSLNPKISSKSTLILSCHVCLPLRNAVFPSDSEIKAAYISALRPTRIRVMALALSLLVRPIFNPRPNPARFVVNLVPLGQIVLRIFRFYPLSLSSH